MKWIESFQSPEGFTVGVYHANQKYILRIEWGNYEQVYKVDALSVQGVQTLKDYLKAEFFQHCKTQFLQMHNHWQGVIQ
jgi:hypothetical protein